MAKKDDNVERRDQDALRALVDRECRGVLPHIADRIKKVARAAYWIGALDGQQITTVVCENTLGSRLRGFADADHEAAVRDYTNDAHKEMLND